jgi:hypothetical protein
MEVPGAQSLTLGHFHSLVCLFVCFLGVTTHCVCIFHSPVAGFKPPRFLRFLVHTQRRATVVRTPLDEWSIRRRDLYLTTHNTHNRQTSMSPVVFELTISAGERPKTHAVERTATGTGSLTCSTNKFISFLSTINILPHWTEKSMWKWLFSCLYLNSS